MLRVTYTLDCAMPTIVQQAMNAAEKIKRNFISLVIIGIYKCKISELFKKITYHNYVFFLHKFPHASLFLHRMTRRAVGAKRGVGAFF